MIQLSKKLLTLDTSVETDWQHRGELLSFDPVSGDGNAVFPDEIIIEDDCVTYRKGQIVGYKETEINVAAKAVCLSR